MIGCDGETLELVFTLETGRNEDELPLSGDELLFEEMKEEAA